MDGIHKAYSGGKVNKTGIKRQRARRSQKNDTIVYDGLDTAGAQYI